jgi:hypothetical protein
MDEGRFLFSAHLFTSGSAVSANARLAASQWHTLALKSEGDRFRVSCEGQVLVTSPTLTRSCRPMIERGGAMTYAMMQLACDLLQTKGMSEKPIAGHYENNYGGASVLIHIAQS